jgi:hypothetical protein
MGQSGHKHLMYEALYVKSCRIKSRNAQKKCIFVREKFRYFNMMFADRVTILLSVIQWLEYVDP